MAGEGFSDFSGGMVVVDPKLGTKRICESCGAKFYDLNKAPVTCPKCGHTYDPMAAFAKPEPVREVEPSVEEDDEDDDDALTDDADAISLDDMSDDADDEDEDEDAQALAEFDDDDALLDDEEDEDEDSFLEDDEDED